MKYTTIADPDGRSEALVTQAAVEADLEAFIAASNLTFRELLAKGERADAIVPLKRDPDTNAPLGPTVAAWVEQARLDVARLEHRAARKRSRADLTPASDPIRKSRLNWLQDSRIPQLEQEHLGHTLRLAELEAALAVTGQHALDDRERTQKEELAEASRKALVDLDAMWAAANREKERIAPKPKTKARTAEPRHP